MHRSFYQIKGTLFNFACRSGGLLAKFLLIVHISKAISIETLGLYNIIAVTVAWSVYVIGFEFHSYSLRHIVGEPTEVTANHVINQLLFHAVGYAGLLMAIPLLVVLDFIPISILHYFILITIFDHLSQECLRVCVAIDRSQFANFIHFVKSGLWIYPLLLLPFLGQPIDIHVILAAWLAGTLMAFVLGVLKLLKLGVLRFKDVKVNIKWIKEGIAVSFPFLIISASHLTMDFSDRYLIDYFLGKEKVGIYSFYYGIANVPTTLITSVLIAQYQPQIVNLYKFQAAEAKKRQTVRNFLFQSLGLAIVINLALVLGVKYLLTFIGKQQLLDHINLFYLMLAQVFVFAGQIVIQTLLYARRKDTFLLYTAIGSAGLNIGLNLILIPRIGIYGAATTTLVSMTVLLLLRLYLLNNLKDSTENGNGTI